MTGRGTQADPYILTTADDLYALATLGRTSVYCRLGCDIDLNGTPYAENFEPIPLFCREFDGNGFCIRNIYVNKPASTVNVFTLPTYNINAAVKDLRLENVELIGENISVISSNYSNQVSLYNCTFVLNVRRTDNVSSMTSAQCLMASENVGLSSTLTTVAVRGFYNKQFAIFRGSSLERCHIHLELEIGSGDSTDGSSGSFLTGCTLADSYVTGSISAASQLTDSTNMSYGCTFNNSYTAMSYVRQNNVYWKGSMTTPCFYDKELAGNRDFTDSRLYYGLTTAQCKNVEYLQSIGFIVAGEE
jgi:hypothetical protein